MAQIPHSFKHQLFKLCQKVGTQDKKLQQWAARTVSALLSAFQRYPKDKHCLCPQEFLLLAQFLQDKTPEHRNLQVPKAE